MYFKFILKRVYGIAAMKGALGASMWRDDSNAAEKVKKTPFLNKRTFHNWYAQVFVAFIAFQNRSLSKCILMVSGLEPFRVFFVLLPLPTLKKREGWKLQRSPITHDSTKLYPCKNSICPTPAWGANCKFLTVGADGPAD